MKVIRSDDLQAYLKGYIEGCTPKKKKPTKTVKHLKYLKSRIKDLEFEIGEKE